MNSYDYDTDESTAGIDYDYKIDQLACVKITGWRCPPPKPTGDLERPGGGGSATTDLAVNNECEIVGEEAFREKNKCGPPIIIDAILEHEKVHVRQCKAWGMLYKNKTPQSEGGFEQEAYAKSASKLLSWMEMFCRDRNLEPYRKQLRYLQTGQ